MKAALFELPALSHRPHEGQRYATTRIAGVAVP
jgi:hypothetical protein